MKSYKQFINELFIDENILKLFTGLAKTSKGLAKTSKGLAPTNKGLAPTNKGSAIKPRDTSSMTPPEHFANRKHSDLLRQHNKDIMKNVFKVDQPGSSFVSQNAPSKFVPGGQQTGAGKAAGKATGLVHTPTQPSQGPPVEVKLSPFKQLPPAQKKLTRDSKQLPIGNLGKKKLPEEHGAGEMGTEKLLKRYIKDTPFMTVTKDKK